PAGPELVGEQPDLRALAASVGAVQNDESSRQMFAAHWHSIMSLRRVLRPRCRLTLKLIPDIDQRAKPPGTDGLHHVSRDPQRLGAGVSRDEKPHRIPALVPSNVGYFKQQFRQRALPGVADRPGHAHAASI